jgi:hypothetical protein
MLNYTCPMSVIISRYALLCRDSNTTLYIPVIMISRTQPALHIPTRP